MFRTQVLIILFLIWAAPLNATATDDAQVKSILVTGATTGIGRNLAAVCGHSQSTRAGVHH